MRAYYQQHAGELKAKSRAYYQQPAVKAKKRERVVSGLLCPFCYGKRINDWRAKAQRGAPRMLRCLDCQYKGKAWTFKREVL